jgi:hypothetical protein
VLDETGRPRLETSYFIEPCGEPEKTGSADRPFGTGALEPSVAAPEPAPKPYTLSQALAEELAIQRQPTFLGALLHCRRRCRGQPAGLYAAGRRADRMHRPRHKQGTHRSPVR